MGLRLGCTRRDVRALVSLPFVGSVFRFMVPWSSFQTHLKKTLSIPDKLGGLEAVYSQWSEDLGLVCFCVEDCWQNNKQLYRLSHTLGIHCNWREQEMGSAVLEFLWLITIVVTRTDVTSNSDGITPLLASNYFGPILWLLSKKATNLCQLKTIHLVL